MKRSTNLQVLESYAKTLSKKLINMLYESKMLKKYSKKLYESNNDMSLYIDAYLMEDNEILAEDIKECITENFGTKVKITESLTGMMLYTDDVDVYGDMVCELESLGFPYGTFNESLDYRYIHS